MLKGRIWYQLTVEDVFKALESGNIGLSTNAARARLGQYGYNALEVKKHGAVVRFFLQFHNPLLYVLIAAAFIAGLLGEFTDMWVIIGVVIATAAIGFIQEGKAEATLEALKKMLVEECFVIRDGETRNIATRELVPGDVVLLEEGDRVPADLRILTSKNLRFNEAALTGESMPVLKGIDPIERANLSPVNKAACALMAPL